MKRSIFNLPYIFALKPLFLEKNEIKWNQTDRHTINANNHNFYGFLWFLVFFLILAGNFHYYICNQRVKIRKYEEFDGNRKVHQFGTAPLMGFGRFLFTEISFFSKNNGFRTKMYETLQIDLSIRYILCK